MALWLTDSRNRLATGKVEVRMFTDNEAATAWQIVLAAEFETPQERDDWRIHAESENTGFDAAAAFTSFWAELGWSLICVDDDRTLSSDFVVIASDIPAPKTYSNNTQL